MTLQEFLLRLATDRELRREYLDRPEEVLARDEWNEAKLEILRRGGLREVRVTIEAEFRAEIVVEGEGVSASTYDVFKIVYGCPPAPTTDA